MTGTDSLGGVSSWLRRALRSDALLTFVLAAGYFQLVWGFKLVDPRNLQWLLDFEKDLSLYLTTTSYFRFSGWSFPITHFDSLLYPIGTSITVADAVPLLAVPFKLLDPLLPHGIFQYFGAWLFVCVWLQALIAKKIFTLLGVSWPLQWLGTLLLTADLPQALAIWHFPLWAHFTFLYGFYLVLKPKLELRRACLLLAVAPWITPYLFVMVLATVTALFFKHRRAPELAKQLGIAALVTLGSCFFVGYFHFKTGVAPSGEYMSDLTTLVNAAGTGRLGPDLAPLRNYDEGFGYLGLGGIALLGLLLVQPLVPAWRRRELHVPALFAVCALMALYALGSNLLFRGQHLGEISSLHTLLQPITARLRATGRFIWPLWHYIMLFGVRALHELLQDRKTSLIAGGLVLALQVADVGPWLANISRPVPDHAKLRPVPREVTEQLSARSRLLILSPKRVCQEDPRRRQHMWGLALFGAENRLKSNSDFGALARSSDDDLRVICRETKRLWRYRDDHPEAIFVPDRAR